MTIPWSELTDSLSDILIEDAIDRTADKGVKVSCAALEQAAKARAAELVDRGMFPTTRKIFSNSRARPDSGLKYRRVIAGLAVLLLVADNYHKSTSGICRAV